MSAKGSGKGSAKQITEAMAEGRGLIKMSVPVDVWTHARIGVIAALRGQDKGKVAADLIKAGVRDVIARDNRKRPEDDDEADSPTIAIDAA
jgi:hypothetical protein